MRYNLKIADIVLSISASNADLNIAFPKMYKQFGTYEHANVKLSVDQDILPDITKADPILRTSGIWSLFNDGGKWLIPINGLPNEEPWMIANLDPDFRSGELIINKYTTKIQPYYPLAYPLDEIIMVNLLSQGLGVDMHACAVAIESLKKGVIFVGVSGAGKSTLTRLWQKQKGVTVLSDDRVIIRKKGGQYWIYGTPWHGDALAVSPHAVPLDELYILKQAPHNQLSSLQPLEIVTKLLVRCFPTYWNADGMGFTLQFLEGLSQTIPCYEFSFLPDPTAIDFILDHVAG